MVVVVSSTWQPYAYGTVATIIMQYDDNNGGVI